jgi:hypothetical protein
MGHRRYLSGLQETCSQMLLASEIISSDVFNPSTYALILVRRTVRKSSLSWLSSSTTS